MSRHSWLASRHVAAICGWDIGRAGQVTKLYDPTRKQLQHAQMTASQLMEWWEENMKTAPPTLLVALMADEREYPVWLKALMLEWKAYQGLSLKTYTPKVVKAETEEQARAIFDALPAIEARGYLEDEGLPPEMRMDDRFVWFDDGGEADG